VSDVDGDEVVQLYVTDIVASVLRPIKELVGFKRVHIRSGETKKLAFKWKLSQMAFRDLNMDWKVERGKMRVEIGASAFDIRASGEFEITEDYIFTDEQHRGFFADVTVKSK
jgi:beta-glucosidase